MHKTKIHFIVSMSLFTLAVIGVTVYDFFFIEEEGIDFESLFWAITAWIGAVLIYQIYMQFIVEVLIEDKEIKLKQLSGKIITLDLNDISKIIEKEKSYVIEMKSGKKYRSLDAISKLQITSKTGTHKGITPGDFPGVIIVRT